MKHIGKMPWKSIENTLAICPKCKDTKVEVDSTVKISSPPIYTLTCHKCQIIWEANLE
jgi:transcription elongation factor Elf1